MRRGEPGRRRPGDAGRPGQPGVGCVRRRGARPGAGPGHVDRRRGAIDEDQLPGRALHRAGGAGRRRSRTGWRPARRATRRPRPPSSAGRWRWPTSRATRTPPSCWPRWSTWWTRPPARSGSRRRSRTPTRWRWIPGRPRPSGSGITVSAATRRRQWLSARRATTPPATTTATSAGCGSAAPADRLLRPTAALLRSSGRPVVGRPGRPRRCMPAVRCREVGPVLRVVRFQLRYRPACLGLDPPAIVLRSCTAVFGPSNGPLRTAARVSSWPPGPADSAAPDSSGPLTRPPGPRPSPGHMDGSGSRRPRLLRQGA